MRSRKRMTLFIFKRNKIFTYDFVVYNGSTTVHKLVKGCFMGQI